MLHFHSQAFIVWSLDFFWKYIERSLLTGWSRTCSILFKILPLRVLVLLQYRFCRQELWIVVANIWIWSFSSAKTTSSFIVVWWRGLIFFSRSGYIQINRGGVCWWIGNSREKFLRKIVQIVGSFWLFMSHFWHCRSLVRKADWGLNVRTASMTQKWITTVHIDFIWLVKYFDGTLILRHFNLRLLHQQVLLLIALP